MKFTYFLFFLLLVSCSAERAYKKLPAEERVYLDAVDIFMSTEERELYLELTDPIDRRKMAEDGGWWIKWETLTPEEQKAVASGEVLVEMSKDAVIMSWGLPLRIRKQPELGNVEVYQYRYERTSDGNVFPSPPNSRTAYKNEVFERHVEFLDGRVRSIRDAVPTK